MNYKTLMKLELMFLIVIITLVSAVNVHALGIAPSTKVIDYTSDEQVLTTTILNNENKDMKVLLYVQGELADYATLDQNVVTFSSLESDKSFTFRVKLPSNLAPGSRELDIMAFEVSQDFDISKINPNQTSILSTLVVAQRVIVNVPYPGKYAEGIIYPGTGNVNDTLSFTAVVINRGDQTINNIDGDLVIRGPTNEEIARVKFNNVTNLASKDSTKLVANWKADANPGLYYAEFIINYDGQQLVLRKEFMVGSYLVDIKGINVGGFRLGAIAKFDVDLLNRWNQPITNVYADMQVLDQQGNLISTFRTYPADIQQLSSGTITGYWDTKDVKVGNYDVQVVLHYADQVSEKLFKTVVGLDSIQVQDVASIGNVVASTGNGSSISLLYILVIISIVFNIGLFIYFKFIRKKMNN